MDACTDLTLVKPALTFQEEYCAMIQEFTQIGEGQFNNFPLALKDFVAYISELDNEAQGIDLPTGVVPQETYWLVKDGKHVLGEIRLRPYLVSPFEQHNGHVGYNIRPSERRKGYATCQLALLLEKVKRRNIPRIMLTVKGDNPASVRTIEKNGGKLEWQRFLPEKGRIVSCYWIEV